MSSPCSVSARTACVLLVGAKSPSTVCVRKGNVYPTLTQQQLDQMRLRRLTSNCNPAQLLTKEPAAHQAKHIMMCRCATAGLGACCWQQWFYLQTCCATMAMEHDLPQCQPGGDCSCLVQHSALCILKAVQLGRLEPSTAMCCFRCLEPPTTPSVVPALLSCSGASCTAACKPCGAMPGGTNAQRCWEYLSHRLEEINQLRSEDDEAEPILVSKLNCLQVRQGGTPS